MRAALSKTGVIPQRQRNDASAKATVVENQGGSRVFNQVGNSRPQTTAANTGGMRNIQHPAQSSGGYQNRQGQANAHGSMARRAKTRTIGQGGSNMHQNTYIMKRSGGAVNQQQQSSGIYGIATNNNNPQSDMQNQFGRVIAYDNQSSQSKMGQRFGGKLDSKEILNTSAPICIGSYIKDSNSGSQRPSTKAISRRQASFGNVATGNNNTSANNMSTIQRRGNTAIQSHGGATNNSGGTVGIVSGHTLKLNRAKKEASGASNNTTEPTTSSNLPITVINTYAEGVVPLHNSNSATPGYFDNTNQSQSTIGINAQNGKQNQTGRLTQGNRTQPYVSNGAGGGNLNAASAVVNASSQDAATLFKQYKEEDGFMRGARIAEKIQEFYQTTTVPTSGTFTTQIGSQTKNFTVTQPGSFVNSQGPTRIDHHNQASTVGASRLNINNDNQQVIIKNSTQQQQSNGKPRATSAYGTHTQRRNLNTQPNVTNDRQTGANGQQKAMMMKERKMQMRVVGNQPQTNNFINQQNANLVINEAQRIAGIGHGFGTQRPASRDSRMHQQINPSQKGRPGQGPKYSGNSLNATQTTAQKQKINNFFALGSGTNSKTAVGLNSSIGNVSSTTGPAGNHRSAGRQFNPNMAVKHHQYDSNEQRLSPKSSNTIEQHRLQSYLRQSGQTHNEMLKIQDLVTNASQDNRIETIVDIGGGLHASGHSNVTSADIRQIKLNYLQQNKRTKLSGAAIQPTHKSPEQQVLQREYIIKAQDEGTALSQKVSAERSLPRKMNLINSNELYRTQDVPRLQRVNEGQQDEETEHKAIVMKTPQIQHKVINPMPNHAIPQYGGAAGRRIPNTKFNETGHVLDRHPLDKAQVYKSEGQPDQEVIEFNTQHSSIDNLDNYFIGKRIGQGAYAVVRLGLHKMLNQKIAVKIYEKIKLMEPNRRKSVKREMKIMERLDHPNIAKLYEAFESHKQVFLIMEFVNGGSLHGYLKMKPNRQMPELEAKFLWKQVVQAIYYCHSLKVTHRDIKLENILLDETKERVKLIDFGFSTCIPHERKVKIFCGTPSYMAPEIVSKIEYSGPPADIWALGVLLFALLCGKFPFRGQNDKDLYTNIKQQELQIPDHVSPSARHFLAKLFKKAPEERLSAKEILMDPWLQISPQEYEMLSPTYMHGFAKHCQMQEVQAHSQSQRTAAVRQSNNNTSQQGQPLVINPQQIEFARGLTNSQKDKRLTMFPEDIKKFVYENNKEKAIMKDFESTLRNQDIATKIDSKAQNAACSGGNYGSASLGPVSRFTNTIAPGSITTLQSHLPLTEGTSSMKKRELEATQAGTSGRRSGTAAPCQRNKINMEAYQAYYNTNEASSSNATQVLQAQINVQQVKDHHTQPQAEYPASNPVTQAVTPTQKDNDNAQDDKEGQEKTDSADLKDDSKVIKNVVHIDQKGANINITNINNHQTFVIVTNP